MAWSVVPPWPRRPNGQKLCTKKFMVVLFGHTSWLGLSWGHICFKNSYLKKASQIRDHLYHAYRSRKGPTLIEKKKSLTRSDLQHETCIGNMSIKKTLFLMRMWWPLFCPKQLKFCTATLKGVYIRRSNILEAFMIQSLILKKRVADCSATNNRDVMDS